MTDKGMVVSVQEILDLTGVSFKELFDDMMFGTNARDIDPRDYLAIKLREFNPKEYLARKVRED